MYNLISDLYHFFNLGLQYEYRQHKYIYFLPKKSGKIIKLTNPPISKDYKAITEDIVQTSWLWTKAAKKNATTYRDIYIAREKTF